MDESTEPKDIAKIKVNNILASKVGVNPQTQRPRLHESTNPRVNDSTSQRIHESTNPRIHESTSPRVTPVRAHSPPIAVFRAASLIGRKTSANPLSPRTRADTTPDTAQLQIHAALSPTPGRAGRGPANRACDQPRARVDRLGACGRILRSPRASRSAGGVRQSDFRPLRLAAQDSGFSCRQQGFESPRGYEPDPAAPDVPVRLLFMADGTKRVACVGRDPADGAAGESTWSAQVLQTKPRGGCVR